MITRAFLILFIFAGGFALFAGRQPTPDYTTSGKAVIADLAAGRSSAVEAQFTRQMSAALPPGRLAGVWEQIEAKVGKFESIVSARSTESQGYHLVSVTCKFEKAALDATVAFDSSGHVAGLHFSPAAATEGWSPPAYAHPSAFHEEAVTVGRSPWQLPGTLTLPNGSGPVPAVVLVHGSGPEDRDETIGPNKPFKDLAWGLASQGIAVLRYVKRTKQYAPELAHNLAGFTVKQETIADARAAVALLCGQPEIDPKRIYLLGHSLGGYLAPRIASGDQQIAGIIIMAGSTRPLTQSVLDQLHYIFGLQGKTTPKEEEEIQAVKTLQRRVNSPTLKASDTLTLLGASVPGSYFLDLRSYTPAATAAKLTIPILVLQGGRDYQVTQKDYAGWKNALGSDPRATFRFYPELDHLFMIGGEPPSPADYEKAGHVSEKVVQEIGAWILAAKAGGSAAVHPLPKEKDKI